MPYSIDFSKGTRIDIPLWEVPYESPFELKVKFEYKNATQIVPGFNPDGRHFIACIVGGVIRVRLDGTSLDLSGFVDGEILTVELSRDTNHLVSVTINDAPTVFWGRRHSLKLDNFGVYNNDRFPYKGNLYFAYMNNLLGDERRYESTGSGLVLVDSIGGKNGTFEGFIGDDSQHVYYDDGSGPVPIPPQDIATVAAIQRDKALTAGISQQSQFALPVAAVQREKAGVIDLTQQQTVASVVALQRDKAATLDVGQQQVIASIVATQIERAGLVTIENAQAVTFIAAVQRDVASQVNLEQTDAQLVTVVTATQRDRATTTLVSQIGVTELIAAIQRDTASVINSSQSQTLALVNAIQRETATQIAVSVLGEQVDLSNHVLIPVTKAYRIEAHNIKTYSVTRHTKNYNIEVKH